MSRETIEIHNGGPAGRTVRVDAEKYNDARKAYLAVLPTEPPGLSYEEIRGGVLPMLSSSLFPNGETVGWWIKAVQLDLEANGNVGRTSAKPLRWFKRGD